MNRPSDQRSDQPAGQSGARLHAPSPRRAATAPWLGGDHTRGSRRPYPGLDPQQPGLMVDRQRDCPGRGTTHSLAAATSVSTFMRFISFPPKNQVPPPASRLP